MKQLQTTILLFFLATTVHAYSPLNTDDAGTKAKGTNQIEQYFFLINQYDSSNDPAPSSSTGEDYQGVGIARAFPFVYTRGLATNVEMSFSSTFYASPKGDFSPLANYMFSMKWRLYGDGETGWNFGIKPQLILPASRNQQIYGIGNAMLNYGLTGLASRFWEKAELHINANYMRAPYNTNYLMSFSDAENRKNLYGFSVAPVWVPSPKFKFALDIGLNTNPNEPEPTLTKYAMVALIYLPTKDLELGLSYQRNATNLNTLYATDAAYTSRFQAGVILRFE